jgi:hypothetical protein
MCLITNVATSLNDEDKLVFRSNYQQYENAKSGLNPEQEIHLVREIQSAVLGRVPFGPGIPAYSSREPSDVLKRDTGLCYDRSRLFDKLFIFAGFETRHIYILYKPIIAEYTLPAWLAIFLPGTESHAVTEVRTSQGWLLVDSNNAWISVSRQSKVFPADRLWNHKDEFDSMPDYFDRPYSAIRGLYSRRGHLYRPYIPFPQFNWPDFFKYHIY